MDGSAPLLLRGVGLRASAWQLTWTSCAWRVGWIETSLSIYLAIVIGDGCYAVMNVLFLLLLDWTTRSSSIHGWRMDGVGGGGMNGLLDP